MGYKHKSVIIYRSCRIAILNESPFKPLEDELQAVKAINVLLVVGFTLPIVAVMLQTALAYLYFCFGHAWSRVLKKYVAMRFGKNYNPVWEENPLYVPGSNATSRSTT